VNHCVRARIKGWQALAYKVSAGKGSKDHQDARKTDQESQAGTPQAHLEVRPTVVVLVISVAAARRQNTRIT
jgi:hypothetical protein